RASTRRASFIASGQGPDPHSPILSDPSMPFVETGVARLVVASSRGGCRRGDRVARELQRRCMAMMNDLHRYDDVLPPPLEPRALMPAQFFIHRERRNAQSSIRRLMYAILEDAVNVYTREARLGRQSRTFQQARRWIDSNDRTWIFSFLRIC